ncbi:PDR/VanB family oxidoreductase [Kutzneria viridogrisea]|uniref:Ferredoxin-NADP reductase n=1 Tax=Kutzneria viridogrisea TaxID=47990 RepID=A0ABR6BB34_9PSEU|nr:ferredoxin-NADP reductase [Kutzneria viridogrisea]
MSQTTLLERVEPVARDVLALTLRGRHGPLAPWQPGAHIDLSLPNWLQRQYSLCGDPADPDRYRIAVRREPLSRGGSEYVHLFLREGRELTVSLPRNNFPLVPAPSYLFVAGGIGITPILPMLRAATALGAATSLVYTGRAADTMPFAQELASRHDTRIGVGRADLTALAADLDPSTLVYCCGPEAMLAAAEDAFPAGQLHVERFRPRTWQFPANRPFELVLARSGLTLPVSQDEPVLDVLDRAGAGVPAGCREGVCGTCEVTVLEGTPEHRDEVGGAADRLYPCVSRALSDRLVLDL